MWMKIVQNCKIKIVGFCSWSVFFWLGKSFCTNFPCFMKIKIAFWITLRLKKCNFMWLEAIEIPLSNIYTYWNNLFHKTHVHITINTDIKILNNVHVLWSLIMLLASRETSPKENLNIHISYKQYFASQTTIYEGRWKLTTIVFSSFKKLQIIVSKIDVSSLPLVSK